MTKEELIKEHREKHQLTYDESKKQIENVIDLITGALKKGHAVALAPIGSLEIKETAARKGRNPQTGTEIDIPAGKALKLNVYPAFREIIKNS